MDIYWSFHSTMISVEFIYIIALEIVYLLSERVNATANI